MVALVVRNDFGIDCPEDITRDRGLYKGQNGSQGMRRESNITLINIPRSQRRSLSGKSVSESNLENDRETRNEQLAINSVSRPNALFRQHQS